MILENTTEEKHTHVVVLYNAMYYVQVLLNSFNCLKIAVTPFHVYTTPYPGSTLSQIVIGNHQSVDSENFLPHMNN